MARVYIWRKLISKYNKPNIWHGIAVQNNYWTISAAESCDRLKYLNGIQPSFILLFAYQIVFCPEGLYKLISTAGPPRCYVVNEQLYLRKEKSMEIRFNIFFFVQLFHGYTGIL